MIVLVIGFSVAPQLRDEFEAMFRDVYAPALQRTRGYRGSLLLRTYPADVNARIEGRDPGHDYAMHLMFESEEQRVAWVESPDHQEAWAAAVARSSAQSWTGYDVAAADETPPS